MSNKKLSLYDFKNWLSEQKDLSDFFNIGLDKDDPNDKYVGKSVRSKVSEQKLLERIETDDQAEILVADFLENGGSILQVDGKRAQIEVDSGTFFIPRFCLKIVKDLESPKEDKSDEPLA